MFFHTLPLGLSSVNKSVAISQSNYIPWIGYFDLIASVDEFVFLDEVQYTRRDWRNRNYIRTPKGIQLLTLPVATKGLYSQKISETKLCHPEALTSHWATITYHYRKAPFFNEIAAWLEPLYAPNEVFLAPVNHRLIAGICNYLEIDTRIRHSSEFDLSSGKTTRLVRICEQLDASVYVSGPAARAYLEEGEFSRINVRVSFFDYSKHCRTGQQPCSILDDLFYFGKNVIARFTG